MNWRDLPYRIIGLPFFMILGLPFIVAHYAKWCVDFMRFGGKAFEGMGLIEDGKQPKTQLNPVQKALEKGILVSKIKQRIESEHFKHPDLDWNGIALQKICEEIMNEKKQCTNDNNQNQKQQKNGRNI